jgi:hypothetical protein
MLAILDFVFSSFWTWAGTVVLLWTFAVGFAAGVALIRGAA